nr:hypothetical protein [Tanacetum cinerariifolium]
MNIDKDTTELSFVQQRLHGVPITCQSYSPFNISEHTRDSANVTSQSAVLSLASTATTNYLNDSTSLTSDIDSRTSCPTTRTGPMPMEVTTVVKQTTRYVGFDVLTSGIKSIRSIGGPTKGFKRDLIFDFKQFDMSKIDLASFSEDYGDAMNLEF